MRGNLIAGLLALVWIPKRSQVTETIVRLAKRKLLSLRHQQLLLHIEATKKKTTE
jgi:hypothetical protein